MATSVVLNKVFKKYGDLQVVHGVDLNVEAGSIYDAIVSNFAKIQANWLEFQASGNIGQGLIADDAGTIETDALHVNIISSGFNSNGTVNGR